ncbi:hypothetical protein NKI72_29445 [Mesorhizobium sp. M0437]|uniref:hypothetical protein n=1 Tax=Mesorhizobium sp. M0437 TaxID=2956945 RepID=UPI00333881A8
MSEYVFNTASNDPAEATLHTGNALVATLLRTLAELDSQLPGPVRPIKLPHNPWDLIIAHDAKGIPISLGEIVSTFYESGSTRDLAAFFDALLCYAPAVEQLDESAIDAVLRLSPTGPVPGYENIYQAVCDAGYDAMQCVVTGGTLVSLAHNRWNFDHAVVECGTGRAELDHASRPGHVEAIVLRKQDAARVAVTRQNFEAIRETAFPTLMWGRDVTDQIMTFPAEYLGLAFARLASLDDLVQRWRASGAAQVDPGSMVLRNESDLTMDNYGDQRRFRAASGEIRTYEKHIWIDRGNRIHFILDQTLRAIEIGYIGPHLRTWNH